jgi:tetratricopeptide (TPR) repeat protein
MIPHLLKGMGGQPTVPRHPSPAALRAFLSGELAGAERNAVVAHLARGCRSCRAALAPLAAPLFAPGLAEAPDDGDQYEFAIRGAERSVRARLPELLSGVPGWDPPGTTPLYQLPRTSERSWSRDEAQLRRCEEALHETRELGRSDPGAMLDLAVINACLAEHLDPSGFPRGVVYDLRARACAELGNARRVTNDLANAEADFARAIQRARMGTGDRLLRAEIFYMAASVYRATRHFDRAFLLLDRAYEIYQQLGEDHFAGRTLINQGVAKRYSGAPSEAIALLHQGVRLLDHDRDPGLLLAGVHSLICCEVDGGHYVKGRELIRANVELYRRHGGIFDRLRLRWVEGTIAAGLGEPAEAEAALLAALSGFEDHRLAYDVALVSLDLAELWLGQGRTGEIGEMVGEMLGTFQSLGIRREAIAVLLLLQRTVAAERLTAAVLRSAAAELRRLEKEIARG